MSVQKLVTKHVTRTNYPKKKLDLLTEVGSLAKQYDTIIVTKLFKVRAGQLMLLRKNFRNELKILVVKNKIASLALKQVGLKSADQLISRLEGQNALIFTNLNPFKLYLVLEKSKVNLPARAGDVATEDIVVPAGNTGIPPGPVLSEFKDAGVQTRIESGNIFVSRDSVVSHPGDVISPKLARLLSRLNVKPIKTGLSIYMALSEGLLLLQQDIAIDLNQYRLDISRAAIEALGVATEFAYVTRESLPLLLVKASRQASELANNSGYITADNASSVLGYAEAQARSLFGIATQKGYTPPAS